MKIAIAIAGTTGFGENAATESTYDAWQDKVSKHPDFARVDKLDANKMAAYDAAGNVIDTFTLVEATQPQPADTLDSQQVTMPSDKTENAIPQGGVMLEKGA